jgi:hypothetical protein
MTRRKNPEAINEEAKIQVALATMITGRYNRNSISLTFNVLHRTSETTPPADDPFDPAVLTSSPNDQNAVSVANITSLAEANAGNPLTTPVRGCLGCLIRTSD